MILLSHPTGNTFVRYALQALLSADLLQIFCTTLGFTDGHPLINYSPGWLKDALSRRVYHIPKDKLSTHGQLETARLLAAHFNLEFLTVHDSGPASIDAVYRDLDSWVAKQISANHYRKQTPLKAIYAYEDAAADSFAAAAQAGLKCIYELPIAYWQTSVELLRKEAQRYPQWERTLGATRDSKLKQNRKLQEIELADTVICPSQFVLDSLPPAIRTGKRCRLAPFGSPTTNTVAANLSSKGPLRILFAGSMSQRKGLADVFAAMKLLQRRDVELVVMGSALAPMSFYRQQYSDFIYEPPRPHAAVLSLMATCHALVLPSVVEGRALVQQEALSCGLPLIITPNTGGQDLIVEGQTGFLVPVGNPQALAEKFLWLAEHRELLPEMGIKAQAMSQQASWQNYQDRILAAVKDTITN